MSEQDALTEKNKVKINGAPFLKSGANMKFYEALFTILLGFFITIFALRFGPVINISLLVIVVGTAFYISFKLFSEEMTLFDPISLDFQPLLFILVIHFANYLRDANEKADKRCFFSVSFPCSC